MFPNFRNGLNSLPDCNQFWKVRNLTTKQILVMFYNLINEEVYHSDVSEIVCALHSIGFVEKQLVFDGLAPCSVYLLHEFLGIVLIFYYN